MTAQATLDPQPTLRDAVRAGRSRRRRRAGLRDTAQAMAFAGPNVVLIAAFLFLPLVLAVS